MSWRIRKDPSGWTTRVWDWASSPAQALRTEMRNATAADGLWERAKCSPGVVAVYFDDGSVLTYGEAAAEVRALLAAMQQLGLKPGDRVSAQLPNWREFIVINLACNAGGYVINPIVPTYRQAETSFILAESQSKLFFVPAKYRSQNYVEMLKALAGRLPALQNVVLVRSPASEGAGIGKSCIGYEDLLTTGRKSEPDIAAIDPDAVCLVTYTSGTTGVPKGVMHSNNSIGRALDNISEFRDLGAADIQFMPSPVTHFTGYAAAVQPFISEVKLALMEHWDAARAVDYINKVQATHCMSATPFLQELVAECASRADGLPSLRYFACGGASVPPELIRRSHQVFARCRSFRIWGCTEAPLISQGVANVAEEALAAETDGRIFNYEVRVLDISDNEVGVGVEGELLARGPSLSLGYTNDEMTQESFTEDGFFRTGDLGYVSDDGSVVITGRKKDLIIRGGQNISAKEIEDALHMHPAIEEAAVVSMPHARLGESICAYLRLRSGATAPSIDELSQFLLGAGLARQKAPERIEVLSEYPRTASGKIKKDILRQMIREKVASATPSN